MSSSPFPHPQGMLSFWQSAPSDLKDFRSTGQLPKESDIVIVGGGFTAAALVTHILDQYQHPPSIVVLEARQLGSGATGRNGGHIKPDPYWHASHVAAEHGAAAGAELAEFEQANLHAMKEYVEREDVDCDMILTRACDVTFIRPRDEKAKASLRKMQSMGVAASKDAWAIDEQHAETVSGVKGATGCITFSAGHIWPYKLIHHMLRRAIERGIHVQTNTAVKGISEAADSQGLWTVTTERGPIRARKVVVASNAYTSALLPEYNNKIIPYRADWDFDYLIPCPDGSIIVGGARSAYFKDKDLWYGNTNDSELVEKARSYFDGYMQRHFRGWEDSGAYVKDIWTGIMGYSCDKLPRLGPIPGRPNLFIMAGWTGHGMPQIFLSAKGMAEVVVEGVPYSQTGLPRVFEESAERLEKAPNKVLESWYEATRVSRL